MQKHKPDNAVFSMKHNYNDGLLPCCNAGAPAIKAAGLAGCKKMGISRLNKEFENRFQ